MSGIYILYTKDGYRVNYSDDYYNIVDFVTGKVDSGVVEKIFGNSCVYDAYEEALHRARKMALNHPETDDGIRLIDVTPIVNYEELISDSPD